MRSADRLLGRSRFAHRSHAPVHPFGCLEASRSVLVGLASIADRDLVIQDFSFVLVPGMRLSCLARAGARSVRRSARTGEAAHGDLGSRAETPKAVTG